jgi:outer membrane protein OmpA-like peptidoglycan-associated protein
MPISQALSSSRAILSRSAVRDGALALIAMACGIAGSLPAGSLEYLAPMAAARWLQTKSASYCELRQPLPDYGNAIFRHHNSGHFEFTLESVWPFQAEQQRGVLLMLPPPWQHLLVDSRRYEVTLNDDKLLLPEPIARWLLAGIAKGAMPSLHYQPRADSGESIRVSLSPVNFAVAHQQFLACIPTLPPPQYSVQQAGFSNLRFASDAFLPSAADQRMLAALAAYLHAHPEIERLEVRGYADDTGTEKHNLTLSEKRAAAVSQVLFDHGIATTRVRQQAFGESAPLNSNTLPQGRAANRRVELEFYYANTANTEAARQPIAVKPPPAAAEPINPASEQ